MINGRFGLAGAGALPQTPEYFHQKEGLGV